MEKSNLQFTDPHITKIDFRLNDYETITEAMPISIEVESEINQDYKEAIVRLNLIVGKVDDENDVVTSFYFNGVICADFHWKEDVKNPEKMLKINGGTVLLSYIRPILASLTMQAGIKPLNLPFINFTK